VGSNFSTHCTSNINIDSRALVSIRSALASQTFAGDPDGTWFNLRAGGPNGVESLPFSKSKRKFRLIRCIMCFLIVDESGRVAPSPICSSAKEGK
jgi:hypothetical protein